MYLQRLLSRKSFLLLWLIEKAHEKILPLNHILTNAVFCSHIALQENII